MKPLLIVVTGRPASGKTTLANILSEKIKLPLFSRDEFKEGYINTVGFHHNELNNEVNSDIYETFFMAANLLISRRISIIIEAAFQHKLWEPKLSSYLSRAEVKIVICKILPELAIARFSSRALNDPDREKYHGDKPIHLAPRETRLSVTEYKTLNMPVPTLEVDTVNNYSPGIAEIVDFIKR